MPKRMVHIFEELLSKIAPHMRNSVSKMRKRFGDPWENEFEYTLERVFGDNVERMERAVKGYVRFAMDAALLHKRFEKERQYSCKSYEEAAAAVYHNRHYMLTLYLPGILLSNYLWPHHYRQLCYFHSHFAPIVLASEEKRFVDVGVGTGFYSRQFLEISDDVEGTAFDISAYSLQYSRELIDAFGLSERWTAVEHNVMERPSTQTWPFVLSVEVLEHLENPVIFLKSLREMLREGGRAFITAALTAPNEDHIFLYNTCEEVIGQLTEAGFEVLDFQEDSAYEPRAGEPVPRSVAFIVT